MKGRNQSFESIVQRSPRISSMTCNHKAHGVMSGTSRTVLDDSGSLAITAWTCSKCGKVVEEIGIMTQDGKVRSHRMRFAVAPPNYSGQTAARGLSQVYKN